jgi:hypothetical protein
VTVTVPASGKVLVTVTARITPPAGATGFVSFTSTGGSGNVTAADSIALTFNNTGLGAAPLQASATFFVTGLSAGSHTFTALYRVNGGLGNTNFAERSIIVIPMP